MSESQPVPVYEMRVECMNYCYGGSPVLDLDEYPDPADPRAIVKYADHLAALAERDRQHAEALAEAEQQVRSEERSHFQDAVWTFDRGYTSGRVEALRQAREVIAALPVVHSVVPIVSRSAALAAIDALVAGQAPAASVHSQRCLNCDHIRATHTLTANGCLGHALPGRPGAYCPCGEFDSGEAPAAPGEVT